MEKLLTVAEVSDVLRVHPVTVRKYIKKDHIKAAKFPGGDLRIDQKDLEEFVGIAK